MSRTLDTSVCSPARPSRSTHWPRHWGRFRRARDGDLAPQERPATRPGHRRRHQRAHRAVRRLRADAGDPVRGRPGHRSDLALLGGYAARLAPQGRQGRRHRHRLAEPPSVWPWHPLGTWLSGLGGWQVAFQHPPP
ncbi:hypothetical protein E4K10_03740 [Streptomyces sp. T1317-0309]|nr:hypothetical protein E4K10_03740 [Streptomyces sp. T1317-0309]